MCKWCENYRFTIRADKEDNETHFLKACYCPMCGHNFSLGTKSATQKHNNYYVIKLIEERCPDKDKRYFEGCEAHWDGYTLNDSKHAKRFDSIESAKEYAEWFFNENDYEIEGIIKLISPKKSSEKEHEEEKLPHFTEKDFSLYSDSGQVLNLVRLIVRVKNQDYKFSPKTLEKINKIVDKINGL